MLVAAVLLWLPFHIHTIMVAKKIAINRGDHVKQSQKGEYPAEL